MYKRTGLAATDNREPAQSQLSGQTWQQAVRPIDAVDCRRRKVLRRPRTNVQIKCVDLAWRPRQKNEYDILRRLEHCRLWIPSRDGLAEDVHWRREVTCHPCCRYLKEDSSIDHGFHAPQ